MPKINTTIGSAIIFAMLLNASNAGADDGLIGGILKGVGRATGIKPLEKIGTELDNGSRDFKDKVPIYRDVEEGGSRAVRETFKWIENNPEKALAIAAVVVVGWAACADGCTFVAGILVDGSTVGAGSGTLAIPIVATTFGDDSSKKPVPSLPTNQTIENKNTDSEPQKDYLSPTKVYPKYYSNADHPSPKGLSNAIPRISYRTLHDRFTDILLDFSYPSETAAPRVPTATDPAGGIFTSPRKTAAPDAKALYGDSARRIHAGTDYLMRPGDKVYATMSGTVTSTTGRTETGFSFVTIRAFDGTEARLLYVDIDPSVKVGNKVEAGQSVLGMAADLSRAPDYKNVPNHVHADYTDRHGRRFDPFLNMYVEESHKVSAGK